MASSSSTSSSSFYVPNAIAEPPLPSNWEARIDARGRKYYVDHSTKTTSWFHPLLPQPVFPPISNQTSPQNTTSPPQVTSPSNTSDKKTNALATSMNEKLSFADAILAEFEDEKKQSETAVKDMKRKMDGHGLTPDVIAQWEELIEKSEERKVKLMELKYVNDTLEKKIEKRDKKISELNEKLNHSEKRANAIKGIGIDQMDLKDLQNFIKDIESASAIARQREIYLKDKMENANSNECKICFEAETDCVILECGHQCCCTECGKSLKLCPICRKPITRIIPTYRA